MILLINPGHDESHFKHKSHHKIHRDPPPLSLLYVGARLITEGQEVIILDTHVEQYWQAELHRYLEMQPEWVGISVIIGKFQKNAAEITTMIREWNPKQKVIWGGVLCKAMKNEVIDTYAPTAVIDYDYVDITKTLPAWKLLGGHWNITQEPYYQMLMTSQGCPFDCSFCYQDKISGTRYRARTTDHVIQEMEYVNHTVGTHVFVIGDDNFMTNKRRAIEILDYCKQREFYLDEVIGHINNVDDDLIAAMKGVVSTYIFSIETASLELHQLINKNVNLGVVPEKVAKLADAGIATTTPYIIGLPGEGDSDLQATWKYMEGLRKANPMARGQVYLWLPLPKTRLKDYASELYNVNLDFPLADYENANFWIGEDNVYDRHFRPWLTEERCKYLMAWGRSFKAQFMAKQPSKIDEVIS